VAVLPWPHPDMQPLMATLSLRSAGRSPGFWLCDPAAFRWILDLRNRRSQVRILSGAFCGIALAEPIASAAGSCETSGSEGAANVLALGLMRVGSSRQLVDQLGGGPDVFYSGYGFARVERPGVE
jgi:hypothetical protein